MSSIARALVAVSVSLVASVAIAGSPSAPTLVVNGVPNPVSSNNLGVPHLKKLGNLSINLHGTPNAPFAVMLAGDAFDGSPGGEANITNGYYLKPWSIPGTLYVPIHPVFDGIGMEFIRQKLNATGQASLAATDIVNDVPSPVFRFNASGNFNLSGLVPQIAYFVNNSPSVSAPNPLPIALESSVSTTVALYMQIVELNTQTLAVTSGTGVKVIFDPLTYSATIAYAEGTSALAPTNAGAAVVTQSVVPAVITDTDLADASTVAPAAASDFSFATQGIDFWMIGLGGQHVLYSQSNPANGVNGSGAPTDQDLIAAYVGNNTTALVGLWNQASGMEFLTGTRPEKNNENRDFPRIELPGNRSLFLWRDIASGKFGFGLLFKDTNTWRNLTPFASFAFTNSPTNSAWEYEVSISPDNKRAVVVLDQSSSTFDRVFMLNLEPGGNFSNGQPIYEFVPSGADQNSFRKVYEESIEFVNDGQGSYVAFFATTDVASPVAGTYPNHLFRINVADSVGIPSLVLPGGSFPSIGRIDRQYYPSPDRNTLCVVAASGTAANAENVLSITNVTTAGHSIVNVTGGLTVFFSIGEFNEATDGQLGAFTYSADGSLIAFVRENGTERWPRVAKVDGSTAGLTADILADLANGGVVDKTDFSSSRDYHFSTDDQFLVYEQGFLFASAPPDRFEIFVTNVSTKVTRNLTRTCKSGTPAQPATLFGPWDPQGDVTTNRPTIEPCGSFASPSGKYMYFVREQRGIFSAGFDRQNLLAVDVAPDPGATEPSFNIVNITGKEFAPYDGLPIPTVGTQDTKTDGSLTLESYPEYHKFRRVGGSGPFKDYLFYTAQLANLQAGDPRDNIDQLFMFDPDNPAPAVQVTGFFNGSGSPWAVRTGARISNVLPSATEAKVLIVVDNGDSSGAPDNLQDLLMLDLSSFGTPQRIPSTATAFSRIIMAGSTSFFPSSPSGIVFSSGTVPRPAGSTLDGFATTFVDNGNPLDATPFFYRSVAPTGLFAIEPLVTNSRAALILNVKAN